MIPRIIEEDASRGAAWHVLRRAALWLAWATPFALLIVGLLWMEVPRERGALRSMRDTVQQSLAPGEVLLVDDRVLGWALERGGDGILRQNVWSYGGDVTYASLLPRMVRERRKEMVVLATPDGDLVRRLDGAGFSVAQEVGWVPWDVKGNGYGLIGRARKRIYFAVVPTGFDGKGKVSSGRK
jgi:hypothetical protein